MVDTTLENLTIHVRHCSKTINESNCVPTYNAQVNSSQEGSDANASLILDGIPWGLKVGIVSGVSVLIIISNIFNIIILSKNCHLPKISRIFLLNLSCGDLFVGLISCMPAIVPSVTGKWPYGTVWCQIAGIAHGTSVTISIWSLSMISIDRYFAICRPMMYGSWRSARKAYLIIACLWLFASSTFFLPLLLKGNFVYYHYSNDESICGLYWDYKWFCVITAVYIPVLSGGILIFTNIKIMKTILKRRKLTFSCRNNVIKKGTSAVKMLMITSSVYFLAWGPYVTMVVIVSFSDNIYVPGTMKFAFMWLANSNSFMNVIIFSFVFRSFRYEAKQLLRKLLCCFFGRIRFTCDSISDETARKRILFIDNQNHNSERANSVLITGTSSL